jgi:ribonucleoside-diphosphate reductase alpha subunit
MSMNQQLRVKKRNGDYETVKFEKVTNRIRHLCLGQLRDGTSIGHPLDVCCENIAKEVISKIEDGITTSALDEFAANFCASLTKDNYQYGILGGRIAVSNHQKNTLSSFVDTVRLLYDNKNPDGTPYPILDKRLYKFVMRYQHDIESMVRHERDFMFDYFGFKTLQGNYLLRRHDRALNVMERPQHLYMRVAISLHLDDRRSDILAVLADIRTTYDYLSRGLYSHASPTMFNAGGNFQQLSSCYLLGIADSMDEEGGIPDCWGACARISKRAGGIGIGVTPIRSRGTLIAGTGGKSSGLVPLARVLNNIATYVNQGGRRPGSIALYLEPWSADIEPFLNLRKAHGLEEERARDLFYALWIPDIFMRRLVQRIETRQPVMWSLMCPHECPGLYTSYGEEFESLYMRYEAEGRFKRQLDIMNIWEEILRSQKETGTPYMLYKDHVNRKNNQANLGVIRCSNLCAEIVEYSDEREYAVCNLGSIALPEFVRTDDGGKMSYDFRALYDVAYRAHINLDRIIDINQYPVEQCRYSNLRHRPVGLGVQGLADAFLRMRLPFEDTVNEELRQRRINPEAKLLNIQIFETIYYACLRASVDLASWRAEPMARIKELQKYITFSESGLDASLNADALKCAVEEGTAQAELFIEIPELLAACRPIRQELEREEYLGAYSSYIGSPAHAGRLQYDMWDVKPTALWDWAGLKADMARWGLRNSLTTAVMPTASTAQILGHSESIEPYKYCIYTRRVSVGEFVVVNRFLHQELMSAGQWTEDMQRKIIRYRGSIQKIRELPLAMRDRYLTAYEISKKTVQEMCRDRGAFIDQTQSFNLHIAEPNDELLTKVHIGGWKMGLKTGMYYLKREPIQHAIQFTVEGGLSVGGKDGKDEAAGSCTSCSA